VMRRAFSCLRKMTLTPVWDRFFMDTASQLCCIVDTNHVEPVICCCKDIHSPMNGEDRFRDIYPEIGRKSSIFSLQLIVFLLGLGIALSTLIFAIRQTVLPGRKKVRLSRAVFHTTFRLIRWGVVLVSSEQARNALLALYAPLSVMLQLGRSLVCEKKAPWTCTGLGDGNQFELLRRAYFPAQKVPEELAGSTRYLQGCVTISQVHRQ